MEASVLERAAEEKKSAEEALRQQLQSQAAEVSRMEAAMQAAKEQAEKATAELEALRAAAPPTAHDAPRVPAQVDRGKGKGGRGCARRRNTK